VLSLRTQLASVSNYFVFFPTIFCLFQRMEKVCLAHKAITKKGRCKYTNARMGEADISRSRYWKIECSGAKLGKVGYSFVPPPLPLILSLSLSLSLSPARIWGPYIFHMLLIALCSLGRKVAWKILTVLGRKYNSAWNIRYTIVIYYRISLE